MIINNFLLGLINLIHLLVILFVIIVPFTNYTFLLLIHSVIVPFIMLHWLLNNDTCAITEAERFIRVQMNGGNPVKDSECFTHKLVGPIYNFISENPNYSKYTWGITISLWFISLFKLHLSNKKGNLLKLFNL